MSYVNLISVPAWAEFFPADMFVTVSKNYVLCEKNFFSSQIMLKRFCFSQKNSKEADDFGNFMSRDVIDSLTPLMVMLEHCLSNKKLIAIAQKLGSPSYGNNLSRGAM